MTTVQDTLNNLIGSRDKLQDQLNTAGISVAESKVLFNAINKITAEIDSTTAHALANADYVPSTDPFKSETADGQKFINTLNQIKTFFQTVDTVVQTANSILSLIKPV